MSLQLMGNKFSSVESPESLLNQQVMLLLIVLVPQAQSTQTDPDSAAAECSSAF